MNTSETSSPFAAGLTGTLAAFGGLGLSFMSDLEIWLRLLSLLLGLAVSLAMFISIVRRKP